MSLRIRWQYASGASLAYAVERLADGLRYDFADGTFKSSPGTPTSALAAASSPYLGLYTAAISSTPRAQFPDGDYAVTIHDAASANLVVGLSGATMFFGDDATPNPAIALDSLTVASAASSTVFTATGTFSATAGEYNPAPATSTTGLLTRVVRWTGGANAGAMSPILSYAGSGVFTLAAPPAGAIAAGNTGYIL